MTAAEEALREAIEIIEDCWDQFSYDGDAGGLSTLERIQEALPRLRAAKGEES